MIDGLGNITLENRPDLYATREIPTFNKLNTVVKLLIDTREYALRHDHTGSGATALDGTYLVGLSRLGPLTIDAANNRIGINKTDPSVALEVVGDIKATGDITFQAGTDGTITLGDAATDKVVVTAKVDSDLVPDDDDTYDLGAGSKEWKDLYIDGIARIDSLIADTADINGGTLGNITIDGNWTAAGQTCANLGGVTTVDINGGTLSGITIDGNWTAVGQTCADLGGVTTVDINGGTIDSVTIGGTTIGSSTIATSNITVGAGKTLNVSAGTLTLANDQISGNKIEGGTIGSITIAKLTGPMNCDGQTLNDPAILGGTITGITLDGDITGSAATVTNAAQPAIESLGTLVNLDIDNININNRTISSSTGSIYIIPKAGASIILDDTNPISVDGGEISGVTKITSTDVYANELYNVANAKAWLQVWSPDGTYPTYLWLSSGQTGNVLTSGAYYGEHTFAGDEVLGAVATITSNGLSTVHISVNPGYNKDGNIDLTKVTTWTSSANIPYQLWIKILKKT